MNIQEFLYNNAEWIIPLVFIGIVMWAISPDESSEASSNVPYCSYGHAEYLRFLQTVILVLSQQNRNISTDRKRSTIKKIKTSNTQGINNFNSHGPNKGARLSIRERQKR